MPFGRARSAGAATSGRRLGSFGGPMTTALTAAVSGLAWGLLGAYMTSGLAGPQSWYAAPSGILIGLLVFWISRWTYWRPAWLLFPTAVISTAIGVALFGLFVGVAGLTSDVPTRIGAFVMVQSMLACLWGLFCVPTHWALFLLAFGNHALLRHVSRTYAEPSGAANRR